MRKLAWFVLGFALATAVLVYFFQGVFWLACPILLVAASAFFFVKKRIFRILAVLLLGACVGAAWCSGYTVRSLQKFSPTKEPVSFTARVAAYPTMLRHGCCINVDLLSGSHVPAVLFCADAVEAKPGDLISGTAVWESVSYDFEAGDLYNISRGTLLTGQAEGELSVLPDASVTFSAGLARFAGKLRENLYSVFPSDAAGYFTSLTVGDRSGMSYAFREDLAIVGLYHAVSLSGMHISVLMSAVILLCLGRKRLAAVLGIPLIILFCLVSGANPATIRAVIMQIVLLASLFLSREYDPITSLCTALLILLLLNPWSVAHWGLQLSFASTLGILTLMPKFMTLPIRSAVLRNVLMPVFVTLSATVFSAPLMSAYFGMNSLVAPLTNLLSLWAVTFSFVGGIAVSLLAFLPAPIALWLAKGLQYLYLWLSFVTETFSRLPFAAVYGDTPLLLLWSYLAYVLPVAALWLRPKWYFAIPGSLLVLAASLLLSPSLPDGITVLDVGQGQCIVLTRDDSTVVVDCGGNGDEAGETCARHLLSRGICSIDGLILTHFDADHCDGVQQLAHRIDVQKIYVPTGTEKAELRDEITALENVCVLEDPTTLPDLHMDVKVYPAVGGKSDNNTGLSVLASAEECDILITGDLNTEAESRLMLAYDLPDLEVLVAGHHGSADSTSGALLSLLKPETVLVSVGENAFGHPHKETLQRICATGAVCYLTRDNGNLTLGW